MNVPRMLRARAGGIIWRGLGLALLLSYQGVVSAYGAGAAAGWGYNNAGQATIPPEAQANVVAIAGGGNHSLALKTDGTVVAWGWDAYNQIDVPAGLANVTAIAAGAIHSMALKSDGTVVVWGGHPPAPDGLNNVIAISAGADHSLALKSDGTVVAWGDNTYNQTNVPAGLTNVIAIAAGGHFSLALLMDGTVAAWGEPAYGKTTVRASATNVVAIAAGSDHAVALRRDGSVVCWGRNDAGQAPAQASVTSAVVISAGALHSLALRADGTLAGWGSNTYGQRDVGGSLNGYFTVAAGSYHSLTIRGDGSPAILLQPYSQSIVFSKTAIFVVLAAGNQPMRFQWQKNGVDLTGATSSVYALTNIQMTDGGAFAVRITNSLGIVTSIPAILTPVGVPPWINAQPASRTNLCGETATLRVAADGPPPLSYQWLFEGAPIADATSATLNVASVGAPQMGNYSVVVTNYYGGITSTAAQLTVILTPTITSQPQDSVPIYCGYDATFQVGATGPTPLTYQWLFEGNPIVNATDASLTMASVTNSNAGGYSVVVACPCGAVTSTVVQLPILATPVITAEPADLTVYCGDTAVFQTAAAGPRPLSYQWLFQGVPLTGATDSMLTLVGVTNAQVGGYSVIVSCPCGAITSRVAQLNIMGTPVITTQPHDLMLYCGDTAVFQVVATGPSPLSYQWFFQGLLLTAGTNATLNLVGATNGNVGQYSVVVTSPCGVITSGVAGLSISPEPPLITSALSATAKQGSDFTYVITGLHNPTSFSAAILPPGLTLNDTNGVISGTNIESGTFYIRIGTANACANDSRILKLDVSSGAPIITSSARAVATAGTSFSFSVTATESPTSYSAQGLPQGLIIDPRSGVIAGTPAYAGESDATISASNPWGTGTQVLHFSIAYSQISGLSIVNVKTNYLSPYLLDIQFALRDNNDPALGQPLVVDPALLSVAAFEDDLPVDPSETAFILKKVLPSSLKTKVNLVLDFSSSISSTTVNGDTNGDGISDAIDAEVNSAMLFCQQQPPSTQVGVYEFHRKDKAPNKVVGLTNQTAAAKAVAGIWTNYVNWYSSGSRCWDALVMAINDMGAANSSELHAVIFVSDGNDNSSTNTVANVTSAATKAGVQVYCVGFGQNINVATLQQITTGSGGAYYVGTNAAQLAGNFAQIGKVFNGLYRLRWITPKQSGEPPFMPSFSITYQDITALSPTNPVTVSNYDLVTTNVTGDPPVTNYETNSYTTNITNFTVFSYYDPKKYAGDVNQGLLHLQSSAALPSGASLYADYLPLYMRQFNVHFRLNWPGTNVPATNIAVGEMLTNWTAVATSDGSNGTWLLLSAPDPRSGAGVQTNSIPWASWGELINFNFRDQITTNTAFAFFTVDTNLYNPSNGIPGYFGQTLSNYVNGMVTNLPVLPYGTPPGWLMANGLTTPANWVTNEVSDPDKDGLLTWQEYLANTSPTNFNSKLWINSVFQSDYDGRMRVTFNSSVNRLYDVLASPNLMLPLTNWRSVQTNILGNGTNITVIDNGFTPGDALFYLIKVY